MKKITKILNIRNIFISAVFVFSAFSLLIMALHAHADTCVQQSQIDADTANYKNTVSSIANGTFSFTADEQSQITALTTTADNQIVATQESYASPAGSDFVYGILTNVSDVNLCTYATFNFCSQINAIRNQLPIDIQNLQSTIEQNDVQALFNKLQADVLCPIPPSTTLSVVQQGPPVVLAPVTPKPVIKTITKIKFVTPTDPTQPIQAVSMTATTITNPNTGKVIATQTVEAPVQHNWFSSLLATIRSWF